MAGLIADSLDWSEYERQSEAKVKVRKASIYAEELVEEFSPPEQRKPVEMFSTKLRGRIEFRAGEVTVWAGYNGHRKSMFVGQVALDLCVQQQRTLIASMEMYPRKTLARMARQACGAKTLTQERAFGFARWTDGRLWIFDHLGRVEPRVMLAVIRYFAEELGGKHIVIDSMMMVCASEESLDEQKQFTTDLVRAAQESGVHVHLVAHCRKPQAGEERPPTKYDLRGSAAISDQAHNVITVHANKAKRAALERDAMDPKALSEPDQWVTVEKQRNGSWEGRAGLWFDEASMRFLDTPQVRVDPYEFVTQMDTAEMAADPRFASWVAGQPARSPKGGQP